MNKSLIKITENIGAAVETIESSPSKIAVVVDELGKLAGTVTDGDIRRGLLRGIALDNPVSDIMNAEPNYAHVDDDPANTLDLFRNNICRYIPIIDDDSKVVGIRSLDRYAASEPRSNPVLILAGGRGERMQPMTNYMPKPMLPLGDKPIIEVLIGNLVDQGFVNIIIAVNYMKQIIMDHLGDGSKFGVNITYVEESQRLGTAGPISLIDGQVDGPLIVLNGDIVTKIDFGMLIDFHTEHKASATMAVRNHSYEVPFGVVDVEGAGIAQIVEKPIYDFLINAGIYVLECDICKFVPKDTYFDMTELFQAVIDKKMPTSVFPIHEYWMDVGRMEDFVQANDDRE